MARVCSECGASLATRAGTAKTCGESCRKTRSRRLRRQKVEAGRVQSLTDEQRVVSEVVRGERDDVVDRIVEDELRPVVREAITEDVLRAIRDFVALTPDVVRALAEDLQSEDKILRHKAAALIAKYTLGNPAVAGRPNEELERELVINFDLPRPEVVDSPVVHEIEPGERPCDICGAFKSDEQFVDGSDRCVDCWNESRAKVLERFGN